MKRVERWRRQQHTCCHLLKDMIRWLPFMPLSERRFWQSLTKRLNKRIELLLRRIEDAEKE